MSRECQAYIRGYLMGLDFTSLATKPRSPIATVYTIGGRNSQKCLSTAERYVPEDDRWEELPCMRQVRERERGGDKSCIVDFYCLNKNLKFPFIEILSQKQPNMVEERECKLLFFFKRFVQLYLLEPLTVVFMLLVESVKQSSHTKGRCILIQLSITIQYRTLGAMLLR